MKIAFICGALEAGKDGVGDYTQRLALELARQGKEVTIIAINDRYVDEVCQTTISTNGLDIDILRIPQKYAIANRLAAAEQWINSHQPEWLSLQFVPFSFHKKGIVHSWISFFKTLGRGRKWHLMFHELWVGMSTDYSFKYVLLGKIQKYFIKRLISALKPEVVHTQTYIYTRQLQMLGINVDHLPLFSNIPYLHKRVDDTGITSSKEVKLVIFGGLYRESKIQEFTKDIVEYCNQHELKPQLIMIGKLGSQKDNWVAACNAACLPVQVLGEQSPQRVSEVLASSTIALSTTPIELAEKSGTALAMLEHGLAVISLRDQWEVKGLTIRDSLKGIYHYRKADLSMYLRIRSSEIGRINTPAEVAAKLINAINI